MTTREENLAQLNVLKERASTYRAQLKEETDPLKRAVLNRKLAACKTAIENVRVQVECRTPQSWYRAPKSRVPPPHRGISWNFVEHCNVTWADLEGKTWQQVEAGDTSQMKVWLLEGVRDLTDSQRSYIDAYYNQGLSMERIAQEYGVNKSTVSRVIKRGMATLGRWVEAGRLTTACRDGKGNFNWQRFLENSPVLTPYQCRLMLLSSHYPNYQSLARSLGVHKSVVSHTLLRAKRTLHRLGLEWTPERRVTRDASP